MQSSNLGLSRAGKLSSMLLAAALFSAAFMTSCRREEGPVEVAVGSPGVAVENNTKLLIALPLDNNGKDEAREVTIREARVPGATRELPPSLPLLVGNIAPDGRAVVQLRFDVPGLDPSHKYELEVDGHYRSHRDGDREREFHYRAELLIPPIGPGTATSTTKQGTTHQTKGPYPALPQPPQTENNEKLPPTPESTPPQQIHPPTPTAMKVMDYSSGGASVGFVINSQTNGVINSFPTDPSGVSSSAGTNGLVLGSGNLYIKYSTDGGTTFTTINNLSTVFGDQPDGGYCCDQVLQYIPSIDRIVWLIQTNQKKDSKGNVTGPNSQRVAWAKPADIVSNFYTAWTWFDVSSTFLGLGNDWLDYPDLAYANGNLYVSTDDVTKSGLVVARISFSDMQLPGGSNVSWGFTDPTKSTAAVGSHLTQNAAGTMYWAGHNSTKQARIFAWGDTSGSYSWTDVSHSSYANSDYTSEAPDGQYWFDPRPKGDAIIGAAFKPGTGRQQGSNQIWFAWDAARDSNFKQPYVMMLWVDDQKFNNVGEFETWNSDYVFSYPALAVNSSTGEVATSMFYGGNDKYYMNHVVGFPLDYLLYITTGSTVTFTVNPVGATGCDDASGGKVSGHCTRSGDFLSLRRVGTNSGLFGTMGYETDLVDSTKSTDCVKAPGCVVNERWVEFGRPSDIPKHPSPKKVP
ncbi:MAG: hypothetical protein WAN69_21300 [Candidatus Korobacteraceae bacterium]|jgi:hypothetical protein